jgi:hypothetical protein
MGREERKSCFEAVDIYPAACKRLSNGRSGLEVLDGLIRSSLEEINVTLSAQQIIESFEHLPEPEKQRVAYEILRRSVNLAIPPLTDEELIAATEDLFLALDARETQNSSPGPGRGLAG